MKITSRKINFQFLKPMFHFYASFSDLFRGYKREHWKEMR